MSNPQPSAQGSDPILQVALPEVSGADACVPVQEAMMQALAAGQALRVDAGKVQSVGTPMMQLLVAAMRCFKAAGGSGMTVVDMSQRFREVATLLGLHTILEGNEN